LWRVVLTTTFFWNVVEGLTVGVALFAEGALQRLLRRHGIADSRPNGRSLSWNAIPVLNLVARAGDGPRRVEG